MPLTLHRPPGLDDEDERITPTQQLKRRASQLGFHLSGVAAAVEPSGYGRLLQWLQAGFHAEMEYIPRRLDAYRHPSGVLPAAQTLLVLGFPYRTSPPAGDVAEGFGRVARYAWGDGDYHDLIHDRLKQLKALHQELFPGVEVRGVVDTAPLLEREFAVAAGLGWIGKNTMLINKHQGSYFFLSALLSAAPLDVDLPHETSHCGTCTACLDACPTNAFPEPGVLDASRCISYLTIEHRGPVPEPLRSGLQDWVFGCDVCQDVCPWNRRGSPAGEPLLQPRSGGGTLDLLRLFELDDDHFRQLFRPTPLWRPRRRGILRNAALVLGNRRSQRSVPALVRGLGDTEEIVRGASAWALGQISSATAQAALQQQLEQESDPAVREEIRRALGTT